MENNEKKSINDIFKLLEGIMDSMEKEENLEKTFDLYKKGVNLLKEADESISKIEKEVKVLGEDGVF